MSRHNLFLGVGVLFLCIALGIGAYVFWGGRSADDADTFSEEYALVLNDYQGNQVRLSEFKREFLIVYAWASWCPYCSEELENLAKLKQTYGDEVQVLAVNRAEPVADAKAYTDQLHGVENLTFLIDPNDTLYKEVGGYAMPETIFISPRGDILFHQRGPIQLEEVDQKVKELLQGN